jgi:hypothetical protein
MIQTVEKTYDIDNNHNGYRVTFIDGTISNVPHDTANRHYQAIQEWVAEGNTITDNGGGE